ncbi:lasso peptide biosynthesis PqqD family chaperone [Paenibacillus graminis]|uniref:Metallophosphoesterase n=1 Tax=Paenibacillus graminis TaxID=189425 RepID=A0A089LZR3_9BACL|nr:lasso peptide biosynthesis PqqD family chaperone [Paenibacillus graminis]AIQ67006.1 metallophosphoesterase [Paenibacillus graminis]MEC0169201.1 lasso peptide biosynthesis PqqD family chaperone [Paenibacillus graminis]
MNMNTADVLSLESVLVQREGNIASDMDGEKVMLNVKNGKYYNLGEVGGEIWTALASPVTAGRVVEIIRETFEVPEEIARQDVFVFLQSLLDEDLAGIVSQP